MKLVAKKQTAPPAIPITNPPPGPTKPEAGVIVARPATIPVTRPRAEGLPYLDHSKPIQVNAPAAAEMCVTSIAMAASPFAASALPPLNPNQPTQSMAAPVMVIVML